MVLREFIQRCLDDNHRSLLRNLDGLTPQELSWQPAPQCMSIGFLAWHCARAMEFCIQTIAKQGAPHVWHEEWAIRCNHTPVPDDPGGDTGFGFTTEQLGSFQVPPTELLMGYIEATQSNLMAHLSGLDDDQLERSLVPSPFGGEMTLAAIYENLVWELNQHGGQIAYLRGMQRQIEDKFYAGPVFGGANRP